MKRIILAALATIVFLLVLAVSAPRAEAACDEFDRMGWTCPSKGLFKKSNFKKKYTKRTVRKTHTHVKRRATYKRRKTASRAIKRSRKTVSGNHRLIRATRNMVGRNPTGKRYLWCQDFINQALRNAGLRGTGSRAARSALRLGRRVSNPRAGDIGVIARGRRGGHVGIVIAVKRGKVLLRGGNQCGRRGRRIVCDRWVSRRRFIGFRRV